MHSDGTDRSIELPAALRHTVTVRLKVESYHPLNIGRSGLATQYPLSHTFNTVETVGEPVLFSHFVNTDARRGMVFYVFKHSYVPYLRLGDAPIIEGQPYEEMISNFPLGTFLLTGEWLEYTVRAPDGRTTTTERTIFDKIGYGQRQAPGHQNVTVAMTGIAAASEPSVNQQTFYSTLIAPSWVSESAINRSYSSLIATTERSQETFARLKAAADAGTISQNMPVLKDADQAFGDLARASQRMHLLTYSLTSDFNSRRMGAGMQVRPYFTEPRLLMTAWERAPGSERAVVSFDLRHNPIHVVAYPGQSWNGITAFRHARGLLEMTLEHTVLELMAQNNNTISVYAVLRAAQQQGVPLRMISRANISELPTLDLSLEAKARINRTLQAPYLSVLVPEKMITLGDRTTVGWLTLNAITGETIDELENGQHPAFSEYGLILATPGYKEATLALIGFMHGWAAYGLSFLAFLLEKLPLKTWGDSWTNCTDDPAGGGGGGGGPTVFINDWSPDDSGSGPSQPAGWLEILVVDGPLDMRGWQIDGLAPGLSNTLTLNNTSFWATVPEGTLVTIYNGAARSPFLPADDLDPADGSLTLASTNAELFSGAWPEYGPGAAPPPQIWDSANMLRSMGNTPEGVPYPGPGETLAYLGDSTAAAVLGDPASWAIGPAAAASPGQPNSPANGIWIDDLLAGHFDVVITEWSQGPAGGAAEWVEIVVVDGPIDMRGWRLVDGDGSGAVLFANTAQWSAVASGSSIVIYNGGERNAILPEDDLSLTNLRLIASHTATGIFSGTWPLFSDTDRTDGPRLIAPSGEIHSTAMIAGPGAGEAMSYTGLYADRRHLGDAGNWVITPEGNGTPGSVALVVVGSAGQRTCESGSTFGQQSLKEVWMVAMSEATVFIGELAQEMLNLASNPLGPCGFIVPEASAALGEINSYAGAFVNGAGFTIGAELQLPPDFERYQCLDMLGNGVISDNVVDLDMDALDLSQSTVVAAPTTLLADGAATATVTVTLRNVDGLPMPGEALELLIDPSQQATLNGQPAMPGYVAAGTTDGNGQIVAAITSRQVGPMGVAARLASGATIDQTAAITWTVGAASPSQSSLSASRLTLPADGISIAQVTATLRDDVGHPIANRQVRISATDTSVGLSQPSLTTNALGQATAWLDRRADRAGRRPQRERRNDLYPAAGSGLYGRASQRRPVDQRDRAEPGRRRWRGDADAQRNPARCQRPPAGQPLDHPGRPAHREPDHPGGNPGHQRQRPD